MNMNSNSSLKALMQPVIAVEMGGGEGLITDWPRSHHLGHVRNDTAVHGVSPGEINVSTNKVRGFKTTCDLIPYADVQWMGKQKIYTPLFKRFPWCKKRNRDKSRQIFTRPFTVEQWPTTFKWKPNANTNAPDLSDSERLSCAQDLFTSSHRF